MISNRVGDIENIIASLLRKHCQCEFARSHNIMDGGFQCFAGSDSHVTFRARLRETNQRSSLELMMYLEDIVANAHSWFIHGQYFKLNLSCSLIITDIHGPECYQFEATSTPVIYNDVSHMTYPTAAVRGISCNVGYFTWALSSTFLLLISLAIFGILLSAKAFTRKRVYNR